jgi:uncharacterized protein YegP (UPF0339 family)
MNEDRIEIWSVKTRAGVRFFWRAVAANNEIVAVPGEGYDSIEGRNKGLGAARRIMGGNVPIVDGKARKG